MATHTRTGWGSWRLVAAVVLVLGGCKTLSPQDAAPFVEVIPAARTTGKTPFVVFLQGTGGGNARAEIWAGWLNGLGVSSVIVDSARLRGRSTLDGVDSYLQAQDVGLALEVIKGRADLDFNRYAVMGFSRGGTAALQAGDTMGRHAPQPDFAIALYPGGAGQCPNTWTPRTRVLVFYGERDESGTRNGNRDRCRQMVQSSSNAAYHGFSDTYHGYDSRVTMTAHDGAGAYRIQHNEQAVQATRKLLRQALAARWSIPTQD